MDTYASAAGDPGGFYDIAGLAPSIDAFFVMAYDMDNPASPSATAPLTGPGFSDTDAIEQFASVAPTSKIILGVPYYGYDWPTSGPAIGDPATGPPTPVSYSQISGSGHTVYWDPTTQTPWTSYQENGTWHQTWFDDPTSLALKAASANRFHLRGLGIWALGMDGNNPAMLTALLGHSPVIKDGHLGPVATTTTTSTSTTTTTSPTSSTTTTTSPSVTVGGGTYTSSGYWQGKATILTPAEGSGIPSGTVPAGTLTGFSTNDPSKTCLEKGPPLTVSSIPNAPGLYVVSSTIPTDCTTAYWLFYKAPSTVSGGGNGAGTTTTTTKGLSKIPGDTPTSSMLSTGG